MKKHAVLWLCVATGVLSWTALNYGKSGVYAKVSCAEYNWAFYTDVPRNSIGYPFVFAESKLDDRACKALLTKQYDRQKDADSRNVILVTPEDYGVTLYSPYRLRLGGLVVDSAIWIFSTVMLTIAVYAIIGKVKRRA